MSGRRAFDPDSFEIITDDVLTPSQAVSCGLRSLPTSHDAGMKPVHLAAFVLLLAIGCAGRQTATLSQSDAQRLALTRAPGGTVNQSELEKEHGRLVWSFDIATPGTDDIIEVQVDASTGEIVSVERETPSQQEAEKKRDQKK